MICLSWIQSAKQIFAHKNDKILANNPIMSVPFPQAENNAHWIPRKSWMWRTINYLNNISQSRQHGESHWGHPINFDHSCIKERVVNEVLKYLQMTVCAIIVAESSKNICRWQVEQLTEKLAAATWSNWSNWSNWGGGSSAKKTNVDRRRLTSFVKGNLLLRTCKLVSPSACA